jgi:hypothetical protein
MLPVEARARLRPNGWLAVLPGRLSYRRYLPDCGKRDPFVRFHAIQSVIVFGGLTAIYFILNSVFISLPAVYSLGMVICHIPLVMGCSDGQGVQGAAAQSDVLRCDFSLRARLVHNRSDVLRLCGRL